MNEPILASGKDDSQWLTGELGGKYFVQRITLDLAGRTGEQVAGQWVRKQRLIDKKDKNLETLNDLRVIDGVRYFPLHCQQRVW